MSTKPIFPEQEEKPVFERNPLNRKQYSRFKQDVVVSSIKAADMYDAATAVLIISEMLAISSDERQFAEDGCPDSAPLDYRREWGLLSALRVCASVLHLEMGNLKDVDDKSAAMNKGDS